MEAVPFYIFTSNAEGFQFLHVLAMFIIFMVSYCGLICLSLMTNDVEHLFMLTDHLCIFFGEASSPWPFFYCGCIILDIKPLSNILFVTIFFFPFLGLFTLLRMSFAQKFLILMKPSFCDFPFLHMPLESSDGKASASNAGGLGSIPGLGRSTGEGKGYPLHNSGLDNSMDFIAHAVAESNKTE